MSLSVTPSRVARFVAGRVWGNPVDSSRKLAAGVFAFTTPGHGGIVAVVDAAELDPRYLAAARATGRIETVAIVPNARGGHRLAGPSSQYRAGALDDWARTYNGQTCEVWIGEEDCEYATVLLAAADARRTFFSLLAESQRIADDAGQVADLRRTARRWSEDFVAEFVGPAYVPMDGGQLDTAARRDAILAAGDPIVCSALGTDDGRVHVLFRRGDGSTVGYYMTHDAYDAIPTGQLATPDRYREFGDLAPAPATFYGCAA